MSANMLRIRKGSRRLIGVVMLLVLAGGGAGYYWHQNADLHVLMTVGPDLPSSIPSSDVAQPGHGRLPIRDSDYAVQGHYTIIEYRQTGCSECLRLERDLEKFLKIRRDVAVRKIDLAPQWSDRTALRDYGRKIWFTPFIVIYGPDGKQVRADDGGTRGAAGLLRDWVKAEFAKAEHGLRQ